MPPRQILTLFVTNPPQQSSVGVQADVRLAVAGFSGTDSVISVVLAAASCDNLLCVPAKPSGISRWFVSSDVSFVQWVSTVSF